MACEKLFEGDMSHVTSSNLNFKQLDLEQLRHGILAVLFWDLDWSFLFQLRKTLLVTFYHQCSETSRNSYLLVGYQYLIGSAVFSLKVLT